MKKEKKYLKQVFEATTSLDTPSNKMTSIQQKEEELARKLHEWYLEACQKPESGMDFNPAAQKPYKNLKETQKFIDRYIAKKVIAYINQLKRKLR